MVLTALLMSGGASGLPQPTAAQPHSASGGILAVAGRQVVWLNLEAPRHRPVSHFPAAANALDLTAQPDASHVVVALGEPFPGGGARGADLVDLDLTSGETATLLQRADERESLNSPDWWPDRATLLFERQYLAGRPVGAPGQEVPRYPSRIERIIAGEREARAVLIEDGRQPSAAPDGTRLAFARTTNQGAGVLVWSQADWGIITLVPQGRFADVAYPRFSPRSDQVAFVAPQSGVGGSAWQSVFLFADLFGQSIALAHGIPWDSWIVNADGTGLRRVAETSADEPSISWSPDQTQLFVYSGTGSDVVDVASGAVTPLAFLTGYGPTVWLP